MEPQRAGHPPRVWWARAETVPPDAPVVTSMKDKGGGKAAWACDQAGPSFGRPHLLRPQELVNRKMPLPPTLTLTPTHRLTLSGRQKSALHTAVPPSHHGHQPAHRPRAQVPAPFLGPAQPCTGFLFPVACSAQASWL